MSRLSRLTKQLARTVMRRPKAPVGRSPQIMRQKQNAFQYSSNRSPDVRPQQSRNTEAAGLGPTARQFSRTWLQKGILSAWVLGGVLLAIVMAHLSAAPKVVIAGGDAAVRPVAEYEKAVAELSNQQGFLGYSKLTLDRQKITAELQNKFPELSSVRVTTPLFTNRATVTATLNRPSLVLATSQGDFLLNSTGKALVNLSQLQDSPKRDDLPRVVDESQARIDVGKQALTSTQVAFINEIQHQAAAAKLSIQVSELRAGGGELFTRFDGVVYYAKFSIYEDARKSFGTFIAARDYAEQKGPKPAEYIDVRVPERAYVK